MKIIRTSLGTLLPAALAFVLIAATAPSPAAAAGRRAVPKEGSAPKTRVESGSSSASSGSAARARPSSPSRGGGSGEVSRTRSPSGGGTADQRTRVDRNPDRYRGYRPYRPYRHYYPYYGTSFYLGYYYPYYYWPWGYWGGAPIYYPRYPVHYYGDRAYGDRYYGDEAGALDLDVSPEKAEVWLDGQYVGVADNYDGYPEYLWLPEGTYDVILFKEGYATIHRQYSIYPGVVIDVEDRMVPGDSVRPEELAAPKTTVRRDERLRREAERRAEVAPRPRAGAEPFDARGEPGRLLLQVEPDDASVYLDGRFLGTAGELAGLRAGLIVDPGEHRLEVVRPGYASDEVELEVAAGEEVEVTVSLETDEG